MKYLLGFALIAIYTLVGSLLTQLLHLPIPSSIISMLLLFVSLTTGIVPGRWVKDACTVLITIMPLFFIPASMGLMDHFHLLITDSMPLLGATILSSTVVLIVMAKILDKYQGEDN
ncbi:antiholin LrgA [Enterovibrio norvegicus FF-33]|uniref:Antiholin LrgA n=1 Tax=Enterovibrio norvegicus FF-454 TaxID=1185651 RepID=A0A1E5BXU1_9GAMM|nr:CidA/LrgA family protein [Enterovibrio norvegicus]OEE58106.1 antiholin LrgA [Enterovibrio norvegicus FF-454]OEE65971.1 antiholin LrgA [Enterovibrio norvegicus FF-33]OEE89562.1 antiholin LrgA [Enterovibrio norvegicus FF-162]